jgi:hypothetical protein
LKTKCSAMFSSATGREGPYRDVCSFSYKTSLFEIFKFQTNTKEFKFSKNVAI